jgi:hypothetical protein
MRGMGFGTIFMAFFSLAWIGFAFGGLGDAAGQLAWFGVLGGIVALGLVGLAVACFVWAGRMPAATAEDRDRSRKNDRWFGIVFGLEFVLIAAASAILGITGHIDLQAPAIGLIVGLHFLPLARLFSIPLYYVSGALLCLIAVGTVLFLPAHTTYAGHDIMLWWVVCGMANAVVLWLTGAAMAPIALRLRRALNG